MSSAPVSPMELDSLLPTLLGLAWLLPMASFVVILFAGPRLGHHGKGAAANDGVSRLHASILMAGRHEEAA